MPGDKPPTLNNKLSRRGPSLAAGTIATSTTIVDLSAFSDRPQENNKPTGPLVNLSASRDEIIAWAVPRSAMAPAELLFDAIICELLQGYVAQRDLPRLVRQFSEAVSDPLAAMDCVALMRQAVLRRAPLARDDVDRVTDAVLRQLVQCVLAELQGQALTDPLTGLGNLRALSRDLQVEGARASRTGLPLTVVLLDVDGLKQVNDTLGHPAGDDVLRSVGRALQALGRRSDCAYRHGGDEFALLMVDAAVTDPAVLRDRLKLTGAPSCSLGVATSPSDPPNQLLLLADQRLYERRRVTRS